MTYYTFDDFETTNNSHVCGYSVICYNALTTQSILLNFPRYSVSNFAHIIIIIIIIIIIKSERHHNVIV